jgi:hypothetical protein
MSGITGILFHKLSGINGWSRMSLQCVDVAKITDVFYRKRLFKLFDREYDYTLYIKYNEPMDDFRYVAGKHPSFVIATKTEHFISKRYKTEKDVIDEMKEIQKMKNNLNQYAETIRNKIME